MKAREKKSSKEQMHEVNIRLAYEFGYLDLR